VVAFHKLHKVEHGRVGAQDLPANVEVCDTVHVSSQSKPSQFGIAAASHLVKGQRGQPALYVLLGAFRVVRLKTGKPQACKDRVCELCSNSQLVHVVSKAYPICLSTQRLDAPFTAFAGQVELVDVTLHLRHTHAVHELVRLVAG